MSNYISNIAFVGATGQVGSHVVRHLQSSASSFNITVLTRKESSAIMPDNVTVAEIDYNDHGSLVGALTGAQILIISLSVASPPGTQKQLIDAAADAKVPYIIPNEWGSDYLDANLNKEIIIGEPIVANREYINSKGLTWISVACGFWFEYSLGSGPSCFGFDLREIPGKVTLYDGGDAPINTSTWNHVGEGVAAMLALPIHPASSSSGQGASATAKGTRNPKFTLSNFFNSFLRISSFTLTQRDMLDALCRNTSTDPTQWQITTTSTDDYVSLGRSQLSTGNRAGFGKILYGRVMQAVPGVNDGHAACYQAHKGLVDAELGLQREDLDQAVRYALELSREKVESGTYFG